MADILKTLEEHGFKLGAVDRIRLARGVVGKTSYVAGVALLVLAAIALRAPEGILWSVVVAVIVLFVAYFVGVLWFASKNPGVALLEGAELIHWRQMEMGVKGQGALPDEKNTEAPPLLEGPQAQ